MRLRGGIEQVPKAGNEPGECDDKTFPLSIGPEPSLPFCCALADGAGETSYSGLWASLVTDAYCRVAGNLGALAELLPPLRERWAKDTFKAERPWYAEQKLDFGAFTTLAGLRIEERQVGESAALAGCSVGDSCLFHFRGPRLFASFPATTHNELFARPFLLSTRLDSPESLSDLAKVVLWEIEIGDVVVLATDAVSGWILKEHEVSGCPFSAIDDVMTGRRVFSEWITGLRTQKAIKNDDSTLIWIEAIGT